jgi:hypothetical protein
MDERSDLRELVEKLAVARMDEQETRRRAEAAAERLAETHLFVIHARAQDALREAKERTDALDAQVRELAVQAYVESGKATKRIAVGVSIREMRRVVIPDVRAAVKWALDNARYLLTLDTKAVQKAGEQLAEAGCPLDVRIEPTACIDVDLSPVLGDAVGAAAAPAAAAPTFAAEVSVA